MISIDKTFYTLNMKANWFAYEKNGSNLFSLRTYQFIRNADTSKDFGSVRHYTQSLEIDLAEHEEAIEKKFSSNVKKEIKKAKKINIQCSQQNNIDLFLPLYNDFAVSKKIYPVKKSTILAFGEHFQTTFAQFKGDLLVAHSYLIDEKEGIARLFQSCSKRLQRDTNKELVGMANKLLTTSDIFYFKQKGFKWYDLGGYATETKDKGLQGINHFKMQFGAKIVSQLNIESLPFYLLRKISETLDFRYKQSK